MASITVPVTSPPLGLYRAILLIAASLLLHAFALSAMSDRLTGAKTDSAPPTRTIHATLIAEAPPAPPPAPRAAPRRPPPSKPRRPAPPPTAEPVAVSEAAAPPAPSDEPMRSAPGESDEKIAPIEFAAPVAPPADPRLVETKPQEEPVDAAGAMAPDLIAEMRELGAASDALPPSGSYVYKMQDSRYAALTGTTTIEWRLDAANQRYESRLRSTVFGIPLADITSTGAVRRFGLAPERYVQRTGTRAPQAANLDWQQRVVTFSSRSYQRPAREGTQDRLSFQFQLMAIGQTLPHLFREGTTIAMDVAGTGDVEAYRFLVVGNETVETGAGSIETLKLDRAKSGPAEARIEVWLAPSLRYLPVKLRFTDRRGNVTESLLESADEK